MTIPANTAVTVGPVNYTLDPTQDLLVAFDISNTSGEGNLRFGALNWTDIFARTATAEAGLHLVHQAVVLRPLHHAAQFFADFLDAGALLILCAHGVEARRAGLVLEHPVAGEAAVLDVFQHLLHRGLRFGRARCAGR